MSSGDQVIGVVEIDYLENCTYLIRFSGF